MSEGLFFFPDNTVFINFAIIQKMDLLEDLLQGRGRWTAAVQAECEYSVRLNLPLQQDLGIALTFMSGPIMPNRTQAIDALLIRRAIADPTAPDTASLGEAQTLAVITSVYPSGVFITDDGDASTYAKGESITTYCTTDLLALSVKARKLEKHEAISHIDALVAAGRKRISKQRFFASLG